MEENKFTELEIDAIGEISNICLGSGANTLSMLLRKNIDITPPKVTIVEKKEYIKEVSTKKVFIKVNYVEGLQGCSIMMLDEDDAKIIADLMMGNEGDGCYATMELSDMHLSALAEAMNMMMGSSATSLSIMLERKTDISTPETKFMDHGKYIAYTFPNDDKFVKVKFEMSIGDMITSPVVQLYPHDLGKVISDMFLNKRAREREKRTSD